MTDLLTLIASGNSHGYINNKVSRNYEEKICSAIKGAIQKKTKFQWI